MKEVEGRQPIRIEFLSLGSYLEFSYSIECLGFSGILVGVVSKIIIYCPKAYYSDQTNSLVGRCPIVPG